MAETRSDNQSSAQSRAEMRESATEPSVAGGQGRTAQDVTDAAFNLLDLFWLAPAFAALLAAIAMFANGCLARSPHFVWILAAVLLVLCASGCATSLPKWGGM